MLRAPIVTLLLVSMSLGAAPAQELDAPYVDWLGYLGGGGSDLGFGVAVATDGTVYVAGSTSSGDFGLAAGGPEVTIAGGTDAFVVRLSADGSEVLNAATLGGPGADQARGVGVLPDGGVVVGGTVAAGFDAGEEPCPSSVKGPADAFVARFNADLELEAVRLVGGTGDEGLRDLHVGPDGSVAVVGHTTSRDLLEGWLGNPLQPSFGGGGTDLFVARLQMGVGTACDDRLLYVSYLGGGGNEADLSGGAPFPGAVRAGAGGLVAVTGSTTSAATFPGKAGGYVAPALGGVTDVFLVSLRCDAQAPALLSSALVGGSADEGGNCLALAQDGTIVLAGFTWSANFPVTDGARLAGGNDLYIAVIDGSRPGSSQLVYSTVIGGPGSEPPTICDFTPRGSLLVGGITWSSSFPVSPGALGSFNGNGQAYLLEWSLQSDIPRAERLKLSTPLTVGNASCSDLFQCDRVLDLAAAADGSILVCGVTSSSLLGIAGEPAQREPAGGADAFVGSFQVEAPEARLEVSAGAAPDTFLFDASASTPPVPRSIDRYDWDFDDDTTATGVRVTHTYAAPGRYCPVLTVTNDLGLADTATTCVQVACPTGDTTPWVQAAIGAAAFPSSAWRDAGAPESSLRLCAGGAGIGARADSCLLVRQAVDCDASLTVRVTALESAAVGAPVGLMARESLEAGSRLAAVVLERRAGGLEIRWIVREADGAAARSVKPDLPAPAVPDVWLRLERRGDQLIGAYAQDGATWLDAGQATLPGIAEIGVTAAGKESAVDKRFAPLQVELTELRLEACGGNEPHFRRGWVNEDDRMDLSDAVTVLGYLFLGAPTALDCDKSADADDNGKLDITDAVRILGHLFLGDAPPEPPFAECGVDPTLDEIGCGTTPGCG